MLSKKAIQSFKEIYKKEFGIDLSDGEAEEKGIKLLRLFLLISQANETIKKQGKVKDA